MATDKLAYLKRFRPNARRVELANLIGAQLATLPAGRDAAFNERSLSPQPRRDIH
ncbi:hypothetical protein GGD70_005105 [Paraburkholderia fungorum]|nr:hypothetical protein [Paraburkholderia fungorum]